MILYIENPKEYTKKLLDVINKFNKVVRCKINIQNSIIFINTCNEQSKYKNKTVPLTVAVKRVKYSRSYLKNKTRN